MSQYVGRVDVLLVSHTHWDREWYRTFEAFRARLVDTVDRVLDLLAVDPGWRYLLDGQAIVVEDYLAVRPGREAELRAAVAQGRLAVGPWYVQPDSLLPGGETHVRNLLEGRRVALSVGACSQVAYTPDSFGHPAQFPQLFAGFGLGPFVYWRGNGNELDTLGHLYRWRAPDGTTIGAYHLERGYFSAAGLSPDAEEAADALVGVLGRMHPLAGVPVVLMNGVDHMLPDAHTEAVAKSLEARTGAHVTRGLLDALRDVPTQDRPVFTGALLGGRTANLLPGVWSARLPLKLANRRAERGLVAWAEPWAAIALRYGLPDERPALRTAWRALLANQAHDSIGGCSQDEVHRQMLGRYATATELADQTTARALERLAGLGAERRVPWRTDQDVAVYNASPMPRADLVRLALEGFPTFRTGDGGDDVHPLAVAAGTTKGFTVDGVPARVVPSEDTGRFRVIGDWPSLDLEFVARDVPALGWRRVRIAPSDEHPDVVDDGRDIGDATVGVTAGDDGTFTVRFGARVFTGIGAIEDVGDRGDSYDFDPVPDRDEEGHGSAPELVRVDVERRRHPAGIERLMVTRVLRVPEAVEPWRRHRSEEAVDVTVRTEATVAAGVGRVDLDVQLDNPARDHRVRMRFPTGAPVDAYRYATTFDVADETTAPVDDAGWLQPATRARPHQGWVEANGLCVSAPGLPEFEVTPDGVIAVTLLRAVGWLARFDLVSRPEPAGPGIPAPEAQCPGGVHARLSLRAAAPPSVLQADEVGLRAVMAGPEPPLPPGVSVLALEPASLLLSTVKPAQDGDGTVVRVLNPTDSATTAVMCIGVPFGSVHACRLDEAPGDGAVDVGAGGEVRFSIGAHALRTVVIS
ncbi:MAG TPA: glycosyl hydrolase-related protein [Acidimicrobiales bacterium]|nr:glycosyl hydrolase-related protein [Acidimicrobiales bacterium]